MGYLLLGELYKNPIAQPEIQSVAASWKDGVEMVFAAESEGAMVPGYIAQTYPNLVSVATSRDFVGRALQRQPAGAAGCAHQGHQRDACPAQEPGALRRDQRAGRHQFVPATSAEYAGNERLLRGVFGYQALKGRPPPAASTAPPGVGGKPAAPVQATGISVKAKRGG